MDFIFTLSPKSLTRVEGSLSILFCLDRVIYSLFHSILRSLYFPVQIFTLLSFYAVLHHFSPVKVSRAEAPGFSKHRELRSSIEEQAETHAYRWHILANLTLNFFYVLLTSVENVMKWLRNMRSILNVF